MITLDTIALIAGDSSFYSCDYFKGLSKIYTYEDL